MNQPPPETVAEPTCSGATIIPFPRRPWWFSAPNPQCVDWCELDHGPYEFAEQMGVLLCQRTIVDDDRFVVRAESLVTAHSEEQLGLGEAVTGAFVEVRVHDLDPNDAEALVVAIREASATCVRAAQAV